MTATHGTGEGPVGSGVPQLTATPLTTGEPHAPLLVALPSLGTSAASLWDRVAGELAAATVLGVDLPGHGRSEPAGRPFAVEELATAVLAVVDEHRGPDASFHVAGDSLGGAVGLALAAHAPRRVRSLAAICTGARIGEPAAWRDRAELVRTQGTGAVVDGSRQRWFAPGFTDRNPDTAGQLLGELSEVDAESYALACEALAAFDLRSELDRVVAPTVVVSGAQDVATPPELGARTAHGIGGARHVVLDGVGHLAPVEAPQRVVALLRELLDRP